MKISSRPQIMGILNITPDSFSDGGVFLSETDALKRVERMISDGADIIDIGGESSRPGALQVSVEEEWFRIGNVIKTIKKKLKIPISVDTYKPDIARRALDLGVEIINDISGFRDEKMRRVCAEYNATVVIMHMQGEPRNMQKNPTYQDVVSEVKDYLLSRTKLCELEGIKKIIIDPGIGFGKTLEHNMSLIKNLKELTDSNYPVLLGTSRKSFLGLLTGEVVPQNRDLATHLTTLLGLKQGVKIFRVHNVLETKQILNLYRELDL